MFGTDGPYALNVRQTFIESLPCEDDYNLNFLSLERTCERADNLTPLPPERKAVFHKWIEKEAGLNRPASINNYLTDTLRRRQSHRLAPACWPGRSVCRRRCCCPERTR